MSGEGAVIGGAIDRRPLGAFPPAPGSLLAPPGPAATNQWLNEARRWSVTALQVVDRLDADAAAATSPDAFSADVVLAVTLARTVTERLDAVADALGQGAVSDLGELCHGRAPVGPNLTGASGGFDMSEAAGLLLAVVSRLTAAVAADAVVASGEAGTLGTLRDRIAQLGRVAGATGLVVDASGWEQELDDAIATQDPGSIRRVVSEVARRVSMFEVAVAQVADDQDRARSAVTAAVEVRTRAHALRAEVVALAEEVRTRIADPPRLGIPDPDALGPVPTVPATADPAGWAELASSLEAHVARARRVVAGLETAEVRFRSALDARNALRGLLGASRDRQLTRAPDADLDSVYRAAHDAVWIAPCDLDEARVLVDTYVGAVRAATPPGTAAPIAPFRARPGEGATRP